LKLFAGPVAVAIARYVAVVIVLIADVLGARRRIGVDGFLPPVFILAEVEPLILRLGLLWLFFGVLHAPIFGAWAGAAGLELLLTIRPILKAVANDVTKAKPRKNGTVHARRQVRSEQACR